MLSTVVIIISSNSNPSPDPLPVVITSPRVTYNDDWLFTAFNDNTSPQTLHFTITSGAEGDLYSIIRNIDGSSFIEFTPYVGYTTQLENNTNYVSSFYFESDVNDVQTLSFRTPGYDAFADVLSSNPDLSYLMNYFGTEIGQWINVTDTDYWTFPSKFYYYVVRGNPGFGKMIDEFPDKAFYFDTPGVAIENGNAPYGFNFRANRDMDRVSFQVIWLPLEQTDITPNLSYLNVDLIHPMLEGETYYFIQKGSEYVPFSTQNYHRPVFWPYPDLIPFGGNDNVNVPMSVSDVTSKFPVEEDVTFENTSQIFGCYQFVLTGQQFWYPYTNEP